MQDRFPETPKLIELQLLRHGESLNQLLSPLTNYFALCGDHDSGTINVPMKHRALLTKLRALDYGDSQKTQDDQLEEMTELVTTVLSHVPGIGTELSRCHRQLAHVSLATNAAELSMVPFELARMPAGVAGAGQTMCLQPHIPVCLTRRSRNVNRPHLNWKRPVRILMIASDAGGDIPLQAHYANLRKLVDPWLAVPRDNKSGSDSMSRAREKCLVLLNNPSVSDIRQLLKKESFTHIHILAHGASCDPELTRFGVVLPPSRSGDPPVVVDGEQLGAVLGFNPERSENSPLVVTLAICQSSRQGGVIMPGSSLAFELHNKGVPLVVGSQFPLTFGGSIVMARELYSGFLHGKDPRVVIWNTRKAMFEESQHSLSQSNDDKSIHDWASMTVYAQLPRELDRLLPQMERDQIYGRLKARMDHLDYLSRSLDPEVAVDLPTRVKDSRDFDPDDLQTPLEQIEEFRTWIDNFPWKDLPLNGREEEATSRGILASAMKRLGIVLIRLASDRKECVAARDRLWQQRSKFRHERLQEQVQGEQQQKAEFKNQLEKLGRDELASAEQQYGRIFFVNRDSGWALVQSISLNLALSRPISYADVQAALVVNQRDRAHESAFRRSWALAALAELSLVRAAFQKLHPQPEDRRWQVNDEDISETAMRKEFDNYLENLMLLETEVPNEIRSSLLQFKRLERDLIPLAGPAQQGDGGVPRIVGARAATTKAPSKKVGSKKSAKAADTSLATDSGTASEFVHPKVSPLLNRPGLQSYQ